MTEIYTVYWENKRDDVRKKHGSFPSEEQAVLGIKTWWEIEKDHYRDVHYERTNTGALEITYIESQPYYVYRIEKETIAGELPSTKYRLRSANEIKAKRQQLGLAENEFLFDELSEPYRDRILTAIPDATRVKNYCYDSSGRIIKKVSE